ncbi:hypothetical protein BKA93DRAFT_817640 [Sparassis latifolia]
MNSWYYPSQDYSSEEDVHSNSVRGNWGQKTLADAKWVRRGKIAAWRPSLEDWETEERARKRIKLLLPAEKDHSASVTLPHLRSPSPPLMAPYPTPSTQHFSYTSFVMDKAVTASFRSPLLDELESATNGLIQGEATLRRALGRLWRVMSEDPDQCSGDASLVPKREDDEGDDQGDKERRLARAPDLTPVVNKIFLSSSPDTVFDPAHFPHPEAQLDQLEKSLATIREVQDDGREYVERLEEIRDGLGETRNQRSGVWDLIRRKAIKELQDVASASVL